MIRTLIIDIDVPETPHRPSAWSSQEMTKMLQDAGFEHAFVWGEVGSLNATDQKIRQVGRFAIIATPEGEKP